MGARTKRHSDLAASVCFCFESIDLAFPEIQDKAVTSKLSASALITASISDPALDRKFSHLVTP